MANKRYWKGLEDRNAHPEIIAKSNDEFAEEIPGKNSLPEINPDEKSASRRDFLKVLGFSVTAATVAASCELPVKKSIPYLIQPDEIIPGVANYYASTYMDGGDYCSILVKTREGRPIKIEGNKLSAITQGGTSAVVQASVLSLYDNYRASGPVLDGEKSSWDQVDQEIVQKLSNISAAGSAIRILSPTLLSPSTKKIIADFIIKYPTAKHVVYDPVSYSGILRANDKVFGKKVIPNYQFEKADVIVSIGADFLGTWISPVEYASAYAKRRKVSKNNTRMNRHIQVESCLSMTGSNADKRILVRPSSEGIALLHLYNVISSQSGGQTTTNLPELDGKTKSAIAKTAEELLQAKGKSLVICGSNNENAQLITNAINLLLNNYGSTIDFSTYSNQRQGDEQHMLQLINDMGSGNIGALIIMGSNPAYNYPDKETFKNALAKVELTIALNERIDETASLCYYNCPDHHYLEAWNDAEPKKGQYSLAQPTIAPLFDTRSAAESLLKWSGSELSYYDYIRAYWSDNIYSKQNKFLSFNVLWDRALHDGVFDIAPTTEEIADTSIDIASASSALVSASKSDGVEIALYEKVAIRDGKHAHNPWLQELPDPVSKITWDNYAAVSPGFAEQYGMKQALGRHTESVGTHTDEILVKVNGQEIKLPVIIQPGTADNTIAIALGYGRETAGKTGSHIGKNAYPLLPLKNNSYIRFATGATVEVVAGSSLAIAATQHHHSIHDGLNERRIVKETTLEEYKAKANAGNEDREHVKKLLTSLYGSHENLSTGHHWQMSIDLNTCIGCSACVVACTAENNVPVVGKDEVRKSREMHWLRIDRYYAGDVNNPSVIFEPMLCQHCDNAPCENVCPVSATNHSSEGLNQMAYNRCFGTRYCANNCPYKVRRFNWFDYMGADSFSKGTFIDNDVDPHEMIEDLTRMVLNPDVTVRSRGVMEKCSFCAQRIQEGKLTAKKENRKLKDSDVTPACQDACPTHAITFGDGNDKNSEVYALMNDERGFKVLEEIHVLPSVTYLTKVRNKARNEA